MMLMGMMVVLMATFRSASHLLLGLGIEPWCRLSIRPKLLIASVLLHALLCCR